MKLRYIFTALVAGLALLTSCEKQEIKTQLDEVQVSSSYVAIPMEGGSTQILLTATDSWQISGAPDWLTVEPASGSAVEEQTVAFSAEKTVDGRTATLVIECAGKTQYINVLQGVPGITPATCAEVINGIEGKTYLVTGICTAIANTQYGNWYLNDGTGELYIYGTVDGKGDYNWKSFDIAVGDEVTVQGARVTYGSTIEFVDALFISVNKSLIKVETPEEEPVLPIEGGELEVSLMCKGEGLGVEIADDAKSWLGVSSLDPGANKVVFSATPNQGGDRSTVVIFKTTDGKKDYTAELKITQKGAILEVSVADFLAAEVGETLYRLTGVVSKIANTKYGNVYVKDWSGEAYVYGFSNWADYSETLKVGDIITLVGKRADYKGSPQVGSATLEKLVPVKEVSIAEFNSMPDSKTDYYMVTGTISSIKKAEYGNLYITDGTDELYVYGCYPGYGAPKEAQKGFLEAAGIEVGDKLTMIGYKDTYNGLIELCGGTYFSHEKPSADEPAPYSIALKYELGANAYDDGLATVNGHKDLKTVKIGTSSKVGDYTITVPAGTKKLVFNAVAWKNNTAVVTLKAGDKEIAKIEGVAGNEGATGNAPYTITVEKDTYTVAYDFAAETQVNVSSDKRVIFYGIKAE